MGQALCQQQIHPSRASMHLDIPLELKTVNDIKEDLMKVHVYYLEASTNTNVNPQKVSTNGFGEALNSENGVNNDIGQLSQPVSLRIVWFMRDPFNNCPFN